ncbi:hypothetical protein BDR05DRAFT_1005252 [Suillus weaverae]|nr:hypothetical protein BDR05DRAFT_1005252 [Suillus weaverae]
MQLMQHTHLLELHHFLRGTYCFQLCTLYCQQGSLAASPSLALELGHSAWTLDIWENHFSSSDLYFNKKLSFGTHAIIDSSLSTGEYNIHTNLPVGPPLQHEDNMRCTALSAAGKLLVTGCHNRNVYTEPFTPSSKKPVLMMHLSSLFHRFRPNSVDATELPQTSTPSVLHLRVILARLSSLVRRPPPENGAPNELQKPSMPSLLSPRALFARLSSLLYRPRLNADEETEPHPTTQACVQLRSKIACPRSSIFKSTLTKKSNSRNTQEDFTPTSSSTYCNQSLQKAHLDPESFPDQFAGFAEDVVTFLNCLDKFPEFTDEAVNTSICAFECDPKYWASRQVRPALLQRQSVGDVRPVVETRGVVLDSQSRGVAMEQLRGVGMETQRPPAFESQRPPAFESQRPPAFESQRPPAFESQRPPAFESQRPPAFESQRAPAYESQVRGAGVETQTQGRQAVFEPQPRQTNLETQTRPPVFESQRQPAFESQRQPSFESQRQPAFESQRQPAFESQRQPSFESQEATGSRGSEATSARATNETV